MSGEHFERKDAFQISGEHFEGKDAFLLITWILFHSSSRSMFDGKNTDRLPSG